MEDAPAPLRSARAAGYLSLLTSSGTLVCCTLPALIVALGAGAAMASLVTAFPALVWLSEYKVAVFGAAGAMLAVAGGLHYRARSVSCPVDRAEACGRVRRGSMRVYAVSIAIFAIGGFFAIIAPLIT